MSSSANYIPQENQLLAGLSDVEFGRLCSRAELVHLEKSKILYTAGDNVKYIYFPNNGMISLLSATETGATIEVAMVGSEGVVGIPVVLKINKMPYEAMIQITTDAVKIRAEALKEEFDRGGRLQELMLRYTHVLLTQVSQSAICNRFHTVEKRLCRWLLIAHDRVKTNTLDLTQEIIAHMLGTPRTGVTMAAVSLQRAGMISYSRGKIEILDRPKMESMACECYRIIKGEVETYISKSHLQ